MKIEKFAKICIQFIASIMLCIGTMHAASYERRDRGRFTIVVAVKHKQFLDLYDYLLRYAEDFDPRYAGSLATSGNPHDEHKNLHITLASTDLGAENEQACKYALQAIAGFFNDEVHINFDATKLKLDAEKHVILPLKHDHGYNQLMQLQQAVVYALEKQRATGIHEKILTMLLLVLQKSCLRRHIMKKLV